MREILEKIAEKVILCGGGETGNKRTKQHSIYYRNINKVILNLED